MKVFYCDNCNQLIYFENIECTNCGYTLGFCFDTYGLCAFEDKGSGQWNSLGKKNFNKLYKKCVNYSQQNTCNWMIPVESSEHFCRSCNLNHVIPDLHIGENRKYWYKIEKAKRRLIYSLKRLGLPIQNRHENPAKGLAFGFLEGPDLNNREQDPVSTGHHNGLITINLAEANDEILEKTKSEMRERYRTLLGHFRHEIGHYYWFLLVEDSKFLDQYQKLFGDYRQDYNTALQEYYANKDENASDPNYISAYASSHPWEDFAETWAHYMHMYDTLETASSWGINIDPKIGMKFNQIQDYGSSDISFYKMLGDWTLVTGALNSLNRSMGLSDPYPFLVTQKVSEKLLFIHNLIKLNAQCLTVPGSSS